VVIDGRAVIQGEQVDIGAQAFTQYTLAGRGGQVMGMPGAGMVAMAVRYDGAFYLAPRVDVKISRRAIQALWTGND
jgi:hypothetical protein